MPKRPNYTPTIPTPKGPTYNLFKMKGTNQLWCPAGEPFSDDGETICPVWIFKYVAAEKELHRGVLTLCCEAELSQEEVVLENPFRVYE